MNSLNKEISPIYGWRFFNAPRPFSARLYDSYLYGFSGSWDSHWSEIYKQAKCNTRGLNISPVDVADVHLREGECACGIYLKRTYEELKQYMTDHYVFPDMSKFIAYCKAWGICVEAESGIRCQHVEVIDIYGSPVYLPQAFQTVYRGDLDIL